MLKIKRQKNIFTHHKFYLEAKHVQVIFVLLLPDQHQVLHYPGQVSFPVLHHHQVTLRQLADGYEQLGVAQQLQTFARGGDEEQQLRLVPGQRLRVLRPHHASALRAPRVQQRHQLSALRLCLHASDTASAEALPRLSACDDEKLLVYYTFGLHSSSFLSPV